MPLPEIRGQGQKIRQAHKMSAFNEQSIILENNYNNRFVITSGVS